MGNAEKVKHEVCCGGTFLFQEKGKLGVYSGMREKEDAKIKITLSVGKMDEWLVVDVTEKGERGHFSIHANRSERGKERLFGERVVSANVNGFDLLKELPDLQVAVDEIRRREKERLPQYAIFPDEHPAVVGSDIKFRPLK
ncbi:MAG: hypothetical protein QXF56_04140 [Candidatus Micrarchaeia archaeon]